MSSLAKPASMAIAVIAQLWLIVGYTQEPDRLKTGIFSSMSVSERTGDISGMELYVVGGANGHVVIAQGTEGAPGTPVVLPLAVSGADIEFVVPASCPCAFPEGRYHASLTDDGLTLKRQGSAVLAFLPRRDSFWQTFWRR